MIRQRVLDALNVRCPVCDAVFVDFNGCCALTCQCGRAFCAFCQADCREDAHQHVSSCPINPQAEAGSVYCDLDAWKRTQIPRRKAKCISELMKINNLDKRRQVFDSIVPDLGMLQISIQLSELQLPSLPPPTPTNDGRPFVISTSNTIPPVQRFRAEEPPVQRILPRPFIPQPAPNPFQFQPAPRGDDRPRNVPAGPARAPQPETTSFCTIQ